MLCRVLARHCTFGAWKRRPFTDPFDALSKLILHDRDQECTDGVPDSLQDRRRIPLPLFSITFNTQRNSSHTSSQIGDTDRRSDESHVGLLIASEMITVIQTQ